MNRKDKRIYYGISFLILLIIEVVIAIYIHDNFIRPYIGDVLVVAVVYCFVRIFIPDGVKFMTLYVFMFAAFVEVLQYFQLVKLLKLEENTFARIIIGSTFDIKDILCYGIGTIVIATLELVIVKQKILHN